MRELFCCLSLIVLSFAVQATEQIAADGAELEQSSPTTKYDLIPSIGLSVFSASGNVGASNSATEGFVGGLLVDVHTPIERLKFETGAMFQQEGDATAITDLSRTNNYVVLPALAKFEFAHVRYLALNVRAGLAPAILIGANDQISSSGETINTTSQTRPFDVQAIAGLGASYALTPQWSFVADLAYVRGLISFMAEGSSVYNQGFLLTGGLRF